MVLASSWAGRSRRRPHEVDPSTPLDFLGWIRRIGTKLHLQWMSTRSTGDPKAQAVRPGDEEIAVLYRRSAFTRYSPSALKPSAAAYERPRVRRAGFVVVLTTTVHTSPGDVAWQLTPGGCEPAGGHPRKHTAQPPCPDPPSLRRRARPPIHRLDVEECEEAIFFSTRWDSHESATLEARVVL